MIKKLILILFLFTQLIFGQTKLSYAELIRDNTIDVNGSISSNGLDNPIEFRTLPIGTKITTIQRIDSDTDKSKLFANLIKLNGKTFGFSQTEGRITINYNSNYFYALPIEINNIEFEINHLTAISTDQWVSYGVVLKKEIKLHLTNNSWGIYISSYYDNVFIDIQEFKIELPNGEYQLWEFNNETNTIISNLGGKLYYKNGGDGSDDLSYKTENIKLLKSKPLNNQVTPQYYGYTSNYNTKNFTNDATDFIQSCLDSDYDVLIPAGYYYITRPLKVYNAKSIKMVGNYNRESLEYRKDMIYNKDATVIYTDKNIDFWHIYNNNTFFYNGTMRTNEVVNPKGKKVFTWFYKDNIIQSGGIYGTTITGSEEALKVEGAGYIGIFWDSRTTNPYGYRQNHGECHYLKFIDMQMWNINIGVVASKKLPYNDGGRSNSVHEFDIDMSSCKQWGIFENAGGSSKIKGMNHGRYVLSESEKHLPSLYLDTESCNVNFTLHEMRNDKPNSDGLYSHSIAIHNKRRFNFLSGFQWHWNMRYGGWIEDVKFVNSDWYREIYKSK